ncbi:hypothetical protein [Nocardioides nanhaiensis]|uniref:Copper resistance protein D domain-containing protein n=1 Tax=Nocardioides nanhaiensis TaxID=1476871 RepID=A0ABP8WKE1_9ACTN
MTPLEGGLGVAAVAIGCLTWAGYVLLAGTASCWLLLWPGGTRHPRLTRLALVGAAVMGLGTLLDLLLRTGPAGRAPGEVLDAVGGSAVLVRLAILAGVLFFWPDLVAGRARGWRRGVLALAVVGLAGSLVARPGLPDDLAGTLTQVATAAHVLALAVGLGVVLLLVVLARPAPDAADGPVLDDPDDYPEGGTTGDLADDLVGPAAWLGAGALGVLATGRLLEAALTRALPLAVPLQLLAAAALLAVGLRAARRPLEAAGAAQAPGGGTRTRTSTALVGLAPVVRIVLALAVLVVLLAAVLAR